MMKFCLVTRNIINKSHTKDYEDVLGIFEDIDVKVNLKYFREISRNSENFRLLVSPDNSNNNRIPGKTWTLRAHLVAASGC